MVKRTIRPGRQSVREMREASYKAHQFYASMSGKPIPDFVQPPEPAPQRAPRKASKKTPERVVLKQIIAALRADSRVASVLRNQSGVFREGNRFIRVGTRGLLDLTVYLHGGKFAEIEVKRPGGKPEPHQAERIAAIVANGGIAGYATSAEEALALLPA